MKPVNAIIIAGGQSSRMGRDKGLMEWNSKPLVQYVIEAVSPLAERVIIITQNHLYKRFGLQLTADLLPGLGPAGGIYTALHASDTQTNIILSCDIPRIKTQTLQYLLKQHRLCDISVASYNQQTEPLIGIYEKHCLEKWNQLLEQHETAVFKMLTHFNVHYVPMENNVEFSADEFVNINTPAELLKLNA